MNSAVLIGVSVVAVAAVAFVLLRNKASEPFIEVIEQDAITMKEVIGFFKQDAVLKILQENSDFLAVATREKMPDDRTQITLTLYDKSKEKIADFPGAKAYIIKTLDTDLEQNFGKKDMLIFQ